VKKYDDASATLLAQQLLDGMTPHTCIAVISTPSVFIQLKKLLVTDRSTPKHLGLLLTGEKLKTELQPQKLALLEWDERFRMFSEFTPYDFEKPQKLDREPCLVTACFPFHDRRYARQKLIFHMTTQLP
jgi:hypothetical protein